MFFSVPVPGFGAIFVEANDSSSAVTAVQQFLNRNRIRLEEGSAVGNARLVEREQVTGDLVLDSQGAPGNNGRTSGPSTSSSSGSQGVEAERPATARAESPTQRPARLFRFDVPVVGDLFVVAASIAQAQTAGQQHLAQFVQSAGIPSGFQLGLPETLEVTDLPISADPNFVIDAQGLIRDDLLGGGARVNGSGVQDDLVGRVGSAGDDSGSNIQPSQRVATSPLFVGKVVSQSGSVRFVQIASTDTTQARSIIESQFGPGFRVEVVSTPEFLLETDSQFLDFLQQSGLPDLDSFVRSLELVTEPEPEVGDGDPSTGGVGETNSGSTSELPFDVQAFPFASFQNAVAGLGLDPEGVLGSTVNQRFNALAPAAQIGSLTGTVEPIGQDPGALQQFFTDRFGDLDLAAETFRDLLAGRTGSDLNAGQLLSFQALQNPDIATSRGRGDAGDVFRLARAAAADRFGSFVASRLLPSNTRLFRELERQLAQGDLSTDFLQFARQQNLLPA